MSIFGRNKERAPRVVKDARRLADAGQWRAAIDLLSDRNRLDPDPTVESALIDIRHRAFFGGGAGEGPQQWPPPFDDRFAGETGIPEIDADELDVDALRSGVLGHGALIVRGLLSAAEVAHLREMVDLVYAAQDRFQADGGGVPDAWYSEFSSDINPVIAELSTFDRYWHRGGAAVPGGDSPRAMFRLIEIYRRHGLPALIEEYLGEPPALSVEKTALRRVPYDTLGGWHQDGAFLGDDIRSLNLWITASDCGVDAPTMELVPLRLDHIVEKGTGDAPYPWAVGDSAARAAAGTVGLVRPVFREGDAIFFDQMNLHRTSGGPGMTKTRYAVESWWFAPSHYPNNLLPLLV
jgi:hypothetical protein